MKHTFKSANAKRLCLVAAVCCATGLANAQTIDDVLAQIGQNNPQLHAQDKQRKADKTTLKTTNNLSQTAVSYSPFFANGVHGVASSELVVSQAFDFPTLYAQRSKLIGKQSDLLDSQYEALRRDVLHDARQLCISLVFQRKMAAALQQQSGHITTLLSLYETKSQQGEATAMEMNKVRLEAMNLTTAIEKCNAEVARIQTTLRAMNGNKELALDIDAYPLSAALPDDETLLAQYMANDMPMQTAHLHTEAMDRQVSISRHGCLPSLSVGYRRNTALEESSHGFLVGASVPLFSNRNKVRAAKAQLESAQAEAEHLRLHTEAQVRTMISQMHAAHKALQAYDVPLMQSAASTLVKAYQAGEISFIDCCREQADILQKMQEMLELEHQYHLIVTSLLKNNY